MVDTKSKEDNISRQTTGAIEISDTIRDNVIRMIDENVKAQPQYVNSISNLQLDCMQTVKNTVQTLFAGSKQLVTNFNLAVPAVYTDQVVKQANDFTSNVIRATGTNNQLAINALDAARENVTIYSGTVDAFTEFNTNVVKAWSSWYSAQQQQFLKQ